MRSADEASEEQALLEAVYDRYDEDVPRLAWADWLAAGGNPWAEVVRASVGPSAKGKRPPAAPLAAQFERAAAGLGPLAPCVSRCGASFDRGTLSGCVLGANIWNADFAGRRAEVPVVTGLPPDAPASDPRWRGVAWLDNAAGDDALPLLRGARFDRLKTLRNLSLAAASEVARLPLARRLVSLSIYSLEHAEPSPALLDEFPALERLGYVTNLSGAAPDGGAGAFDWIAASEAARSRLRQVRLVAISPLERVLREAPRFRALEAVMFNGVVVSFTPRGPEAFVYDFGAWVDRHVGALGRGALAAIEVDARLAKRKNVGDRLAALAASIGARLVVHPKPAAPERLSRWRWV